MKKAIILLLQLVAINGTTQNAAQPIMHKTSIEGISKENREKIIDKLNHIVADISVLTADLKQAHWNIKGPDFISLHELFDKLEAALLPEVDLLAERIASLGGTVKGTVRAAAKNSDIKEYPLDIFDANKHLTNLAERHAQLGKEARENIKIFEELGDMVTSDMFIDLANILDKSLWFIEAHFQK